MRIGFADGIPWDYSVGTVDERPLGGAQSAACYLARALARRGHLVSYFSQSSYSGFAHGVSCYSWRQVTPEFCAQLDLDVLILILAAPDVELMRSSFGPRVRLVLWTGHAHDQPALAYLREPALRHATDMIALVSEWQSARFQEHLGVEQERIAVLRNAIAPAFENLFAGGMIGAHKVSPPVLAYTPTPFRGLGVLLKVFPEIQARVPGTRLQIFSSMKVYNLELGQDEFRGLYEQAGRMEGVEYVGSLPQPALAQALRGVTMLAYPNIFPETSCISVMEAMAAGCQVVTSHLAALPETTAGYAKLIARESSRFEQDFVEAVVTGLQERDSPPSQENIRRQVEFANREYTWEARAREWETRLKWLSS